MSYQNDGLVGGGEQDRQFFAEIGSRLLVKRGEWLVHQKNVGLQAQRTGERRALFHAARELMRIVVREFREADRFNRFHRALLALPCGTP